MGVWRWSRAKPCRIAMWHNHIGVWWKILTYRPKLDMAEILKPATDIHHGAGMADIHQYMSALHSLIKRHFFNLKRYQMILNIATILASKILK
jgi:hypothetical protein